MGVCSSSFCVLPFPIGDRTSASQQRWNAWKYASSITGVPVFIWVWPRPSVLSCWARFQKWTRPVVSPIFFVLYQGHDRWLLRLSRLPIRLIAYFARSEPKKAPRMFLPAVAMSPIQSGIVVRLEPSAAHVPHPVRGGTSSTVKTCLMPFQIPLKQPCAVWGGGGVQSGRSPGPWESRACIMPGS